MNSLSGRRILFAVPASRFDEAQFFQMWQILAEQGAWLVCASDSQTGVAVGEDGAHARASTTISDAHVERFDAVVVIAGGDVGDVASRAKRKNVPVVSLKKGAAIARALAELMVRVSKSKRRRLDPPDVQPAI